MTLDLGMVPFGVPVVPILPVVVAARSASVAWPDRVGGGLR